VVSTPEPFILRSQRLGCLPIVNFFLTRIGLAEHLGTYLPAGDARLRLAPAAVITVLVRNIVAGHRPVYALGEWAARYDMTVLGLGPGETELLNDDRVGRTLDRLFDADRASMITKTVLGVIGEFSIETNQLHNDSTTVTVTGNYPDADGRERGGKPTPAIGQGHNKDFRPDLKQLLFILTISADGAVPIAYRVADGNTPDDVTHVPTWDELRALLGRPGFCMSRTASCARNRRWATSTATADVSSRSCRTVGVRTPGSGTGRRPTRRPGPRPGAHRAHARATPIGSGGPSKRQRRRSMATG
jgi:hypothetical protein